MTFMQLASAHRAGKPLTLADLAQFIADLSAAGVPTTAVPVCSGSWDPCDPTAPTTMWPATLLGVMVDDDEMAALLRARAERGAPPADRITRLALDYVEA